MNKMRFPLLKRKGSAPKPDGIPQGWIRKQSQPNPEELALELITSPQNFSLNANEVQLNIAHGMKRLFNADSVSLFLLEEDEPNIFLQKSLNGSKSWAIQKRIRLDSGRVWECLDDRAIKSEEVSGNHGHKQYANWFPLVVNDQKLGVVQLELQQPQLPDAEMRLMLSLTAVLSNAIHTRRIMANLKGYCEELERSREEIINSRNILRAAFDNVPASTYIVNREYRIVAVNKLRAARAGMAPSQVAGKRCFEVLFNRQSACEGCLVEESSSTHNTTRRQSSDENHRDWEIHTIPILEEDQNTSTRIIVVEQDVTEKRLMEANLIHSEKLATIGQLAAGVAHDINNPLAAIIANAQLLERSLGDDPSDNREMVSLISTAGDRASRVVQNLLDISRVNQKSSELLDLNATILNVVQLLQHRLRANSINLRMELDPNAPRLAVRKDHIEGIIINLIMNAIDAMEGSLQEIQVCTRFEDEHFHLDVRDNGRGIVKEHLEHIFDPFFTTKLAGSGTGLGLAICKKIVNEYGGSITVESEPGAGTCFHILLPRALQG